MNSNSTSTQSNCQRGLIYCMKYYSFSTSSVWRGSVHVRCCVNEGSAQHSWPHCTNTSTRLTLNLSASPEWILLTCPFLCAQEQRERLAWQPSLIRLTPLTWRSSWRTWRRLSLRTPDLCSSASFRRSTRQVKCSVRCHLCKRIHPKLRYSEANKKLPLVLKDLWIRRWIFDWIVVCFS